MTVSLIKKKEKKKNLGLIISVEGAWRILERLAYVGWPDFLVGPDGSQFMHHFQAQEVNAFLSLSKVIWYYMVRPKGSHFM